MLKNVLMFVFIFFNLLFVMIFYFRCNICKMFVEGDFFSSKIDFNLEEIVMMFLLSDIYGAFFESFVVKLVEIFGNYKIFRKMVFFWCSVVVEVCLIWKEFMVLML